MLKSVLALVNSTRRICGNHRVKEFSDNTRVFIYHNTVICAVDDSRRTFNTGNGGWNTSSTTRAVNSYKQAFKGMGYTVDNSLPCGYRD